MLDPDTDQDHGSSINEAEVCALQLVFLFHFHACVIPSSATVISTLNTSTVAGVFSGSFR